MLIKDQKKRVLYGILCLSGVLIYYLTYFNKFIPLSEGWYANYSELLLNGKLPYKDFFYYLPPFNLLLDTLTWKLSSGNFLIMRSFRLFERLFIVALFYLILTKNFKYTHTAFACFIGGIAGSSTSYDLLGDYSQSVMVWLLFILIFIIKFVSYENYKSKLNNAFMIGIILGITIFVKQNAFAIFSLVLFIGLIGYSIQLKDKNFYKYCLVVIAGMALIFSVVCLVLFKLNILIPFFQQVYLSNSKGGSPLGIILKPIINVLTLYPLAFGLGLIIFIICLTRENYNKKFLIILEELLVIIITTFIVKITFSAPISSIFSFQQLVFSLITFILIVFTNYYMFNLSKAKYSKIIINAINITLIILCIYIAYDYQIELFSIFNLHPLFKYITAVSYYFLIFEGFYYLTKISKDNPKNSVIYFIIVTAIAEGFTSSVAATNYINERTMILLLPITIVLLLSFVNVTYFTKLSVYIISILLIILCFVQKLREPYNWWGYIDEPLNEKTVQMNVEGLKGFKLSPYEAKTYNEVIKVINSNSNKNTTILSYPYVQILSVLTNHTDINRFVPVYFYDVCPDEMAIEDAKKLKENPPDIIIYMTIPGCMEIHEKLFRDGKESGQRKIVEFIKDSTENNYTLIGQIANLYVFKDLKGKEPKYTYIENDDISQIFDDIK